MIFDCLNDAILHAKEYEYEDISIKEKLWWRAHAEYLADLRPKMKNALVDG